MKKNKGFVVISVIFAALLALSAAFSIVGILGDSPSQYILNLIGVIYLFLYCCSGYKKTGSLYFRLFAGIIALKEAVALMHMAVYEAVPLFSLVLVLIGYSCYLVFAVGQNLGKTTSYYLCAINVFVAAVAFIFSALNAQYLGAIGFNESRLLFAVILGVMVWVKYRDKDERGTK